MVMPGISYIEQCCLGFGLANFSLATKVRPLVSYVEGVAKSVLPFSSDALTHEQHFIINSGLQGKGKSKRAYSTHHTEQFLPFLKSQQKSAVCRSLLTIYTI